MSADFGQLFRDLAVGLAPNFSFMVPNQCHDPHARGATEAGTGCSVDTNDIIQGDAAMSNIVSAIKSSPVWKNSERHSAIVIVWDENDYTNVYNDNRVVATVETNYRTSARITSANP